MQEHSTQQEADSSPMDQKKAAEKLSGALMSLSIAGDGTANKAVKSSPASDAMSLEHELNTTSKDSAPVDKDSDCQRNTAKSAKKKLADKERSKKKRAMKNLENKGVCMESIGKEGEGKNDGEKDVNGDNADGNCTLEELLEEGKELLEDLRYFKMQDRMTLSVHPVMRAALMEEGAARREENHKDWTIRRDSFVASGEAFISSKMKTAQKASTKENEAIGLLKEYLLMKIIVL
ncbi:hypothetical protein GCG54_00006502 [Colletotrichum gloeosporioides]|uniref:Uncharacterized protein n=1 Tax=Colletotrichum gloeosporioides TaxID=474922 RepID=A0A8H4CRN6_COLGL|nr:uncharacterized protein GCG54_00006502 [Colletotrichum gloeosporioides]KAF3808636.1 hypothetical protein GCG54_00006502 [Colletotrichum gloeosporioides]